MALEKSQGRDRFEKSCWVGTQGEKEGDTDREQFLSQAPNSLF